MTVSQSVSGRLQPAKRSLTVFRLALLVAVVHVGFAGLRPAPGVAELLLFEAAIGVFIVATELWHKRSVSRALSAGLAVAAVVGSVLFLLWMQLPLWGTALLFGAGIAALLYGTHRYQLVALGEVQGENEH